MTALIIICAVIILFLLVLFLPVSVFLKFENEFYVKIKFAGITVFNIPNKKAEKNLKQKASPEKEHQSKENSASKQGKALFMFLKEKYGFFGAVKKVFLFLNDILTHIKNLLRHIKIKKLCLNLTVSGENAAETAVVYGKVCSTAYPVLSFLDSFSAISLKQINIRSDFSENKKEFNFSLIVKLQIFYMLISAFKIYKDYKNFTLKENYHERK